MNLWIRVDANIGGNKRVWRYAHRLADLCGDSAEAPFAVALGHLVLFWGAVAQYAPDGFVKDVPDALMETWGLWKGKPGAFARAVREEWVKRGYLQDWQRDQGKLLELAEKERKRWHERQRKARSPGGASAEAPAEAPGQHNKTKHILLPRIKIAGKGTER